MPPILTIVAAKDLLDEQIKAFSTLEGAGSIDRLGTNAVDIPLTVLPGLDEVETRAQDVEVDFALFCDGVREKKLLQADMDSTIIEQECLDELANLAGVGMEVSAVTERAMRGELNFEAALTERVARLKGVSVSTCDDVIAGRLTLSQGAKTLIATMNARGAHTVLVSGGFDMFVSAIAKACDFHAFHANRLEVDRQKLTGNVIHPILGREAKAEILQNEAMARGISVHDAITLGDGANDLGMIEASGFGIAYKAKPVTAAAADAVIRYTDLTAALYFQGIRQNQFAA